MTNAPEILTFEPHVFIEINDVFTGTRKLARVTDTGHSYFDLDGEGDTPFPIYAALEPVEAGNILGWGLHIVDNHPEEHAAFQALIDALLNSGLSVLTYNRAAYWAFLHRNYDVDAAKAEGQRATEWIAAGRRKMDTIIAVAGSTA